MAAVYIQKYLQSLTLFGIKFGLSNMETLLASAGFPQNAYKTIHIAGTNGKGSTASMIARMLAAHDLKVGLYTSPHICHLAERIKIINPLQIEKTISEKALSGLAEEVKKLSRNLPPGASMTFFEAVTAIAFMYFEKMKVDIAIMEVGMGGRLDATNVIRPLVTVITNIAKDHTYWLGDNIRKIAGEKAGIVKNRIPCISGETKKEALLVLKKTCEKQRAPLWGVLFQSHRTCHAQKKISVKANGSLYENFTVPLLGLHQRDNLAAAITSLHVLRDHFPIQVHRMRQGLKHTRWPCRFEIVSKNPYVVLDAAHNAPAFHVLKDNLNGYFFDKDIYLILSILDDKHAALMCRILIPRVRQVAIVRLKTARFRHVDRLAGLVKNLGRAVKIYPDFISAFSETKKNLQKPERDVVLVTGSIYLLEHATKKFQRAS